MPTPQDRMASIETSDWLVQWMGLTVEVTWGLELHEDIHSTEFCYVIVILLYF